MHLLVVLSSLISLVGCKVRCGGILTASRGIIHTPGFPDTIPTPIHCEWVIEVQNFGTVTSNTSIIIYFTQLYVQEGLKFTEYQVYDKTYQLDGRTIHKVNETNVVQVRWVQSFQNYLVINLDLENKDSAHLRVLDRFLDTYGFNITYEVTVNKAVNEDACTMMDCGFTGICYDYFTKFSCECFPGYSGAHCSSGPNSLCTINGESTCKNGATCIHVGVSAVKCLCTENFTGETCEKPKIQRTTKLCDNCVSTCPFNGTLENPCWCIKEMGKSSSNDRIRYLATIHFSNLPNLKGDLLKTFMEIQLMKNLKVNYPKVDDLTVESVQHYQSGDAEVTFHLFILKKDEKRVKAILAKWADRGFIGNLTVPDKEFVFRPQLDLQSVSINQVGVIRQNDEFILSCVARGSPTISFRWFKDGHFVNVTGNYNHKWTRLIKDPHLDNQYTSILGVERANFLDSGTFTCQIEDGQMQQCLSRRVTIRTPPIIKVEPMSLTVKRGENFTIKCFSMGDSQKKYTYSWTKNHELIPVRANTEKYEILYPGGSILQVFNIEKSVKYSCLVQDDAVSGEVEVDVHVIDREGVRTCSRHQYLGTVWSETAPDTYSIQECPKGFAFPGFARRSCTLKDGHRPIWLLPDYSQCGAESIVKLERKIQLLHLGYETITPSSAIQSCLRYLKAKSNVYPGEGARILVLIQNMIKLKNVVNDLLSHTKLVLEAIDRISQYNNSLTTPEHVKLLQQVVNQQVEISSLNLMRVYFPLQLTFSSIDYGFMVMNSDQLDVNIPYSNVGIHNWIPLKAKIKLKNKEEENPTNRSIFAAVVYRNLSLFLTPRSVIRLRDGTEAEYEIISHIAHLWFPASNQSDYWRIEQVLLEFQTNGKRGFKNNEKWYIRCALTDIFTNLWNITVCTTKLTNSTFIGCHCPRSGTFALLAIKNYIKVEKDGPEPLGYVVLLGCSSCFILSLICSVLLTVHWFFKKSCVTFLKLQCSLSISGVMITFIFCTIQNPIENIFVNIMGLIEILILMALSAHISTLLIIYTELVDLPKSSSSKQTVIAISSGVPVLTVFGNHLAHRTMDIKVPSWWLIFGTMAFYIFATVTIVIICLFLLLYFTIVNKLKKLSIVYEKEKFMEKRIMLLRRSACIFCFLIIYVGSSLNYINFLEITWCHYIYCATVIALGLVLLICYVVKSEIGYSEWFKRGMKPKPKSFFGIESNTNPLNFYTKEDAEVESESIPHQRKPLKKRECCPLSETYKSALPECVAGTMETFVCTEKTFCEKPQLNDIESYNKSPRQGIKIYNKDSDPDIITSKIYTKLDLVISHEPVRIDDDKEATVTTVKQNETPTKGAITLSDVVERTQPDGREKILNISEKVFLEKTKSTDNLDGMLDKISQDLDYLLNDRINEECTIIKHGRVGTLRRSKPPSPIQEIEEIEDEA